MPVPHALRSIRRRIIALSLLLAVLLLGVVLHTEGRVRQAASRSQDEMVRQQAFTVGIAELKNAVYAMESSLYRYSVLQDNSARANVDRLLQEIGQRTQALGAEGGLTDDDVHRSFGTLTDALALVDREVRDLLDIIATLDQRFPASPIITGKLYPLNGVFSEALQQAMLDLELEADGVAVRDMQRLLQDMRYLWSQQISVARLFIAHRSGVFGAPEEGVQEQLRNRAQYMDEIRRLLEIMRRRAQASQMGQLQESVAAMLAAMNGYEYHFGEMVEIYLSGAWRGDIAELRHTVQPLFAEVRRNFGAIETQLGLLGSQGVMGSLRLTEELTDFLWSITGVVVVLLALAYLAYELAIRRPIDQVIMALRALGRGEAYTPLLRTYAYETDTLLHAFREMQNQVHGREIRLASILDNASDGIITINEHGVIETFNAAAESLFQYRADDVIGQKVNILMPHPMCEEHDRYIQHYLATGEQRIIGNEMAVNAQRRDGMVFPMSIKVGEMKLDGQRYFTAIVSDISERKALLDHLRQLAEHDSLTGLYNRQYFTDELERVVQRSRRQQGLDTALLYIDLDNFKFVNDTLGHLAGDQVLIEVAALLTRRSRKSDLIARLGGDEFAILIYDVEQHQALSTAEIYRQMMADYTFRHDGRVIDIGCSIGLAMFDGDVASREDLMARADVACHMAKRAGRNCVHAFEANDRTNMDTMFADMGWARSIKEAIEKDSFAFALQPIVTVAQGTVANYELLLRMRGTGGELIMPSGFMPSAERFGLILEIDRWVVRHAIPLLAAGLIEPAASLSINLSAMAIGDPEVLRLITLGVEHHSVDPRRLTFEITETIAMADLGAAVEFLASVRALGCATALDDFGVGYSSFSYLKDLPVDYVKVDGSFVRDIAKDAVQLAMVKSMNEIAHAMGKLTVAEHVDDEEVLRLLGALDVDFAQGYLVGKPRLIEAGSHQLTKPCVQC